MATERPRVLIVDDEVRLAEALRQGLSRRGFDATSVHDGNEGYQKARTGGYDLILLDLMLPGMSGYKVVEALRKDGIQTPVLMLTAKDGEYDQADAFELGVDDYVTKPFSTVVLLARMNALLRRRPDVAPVITAGRLRIEPRRHRCWIADNEVVLTAREFAVLVYLAEHADQAVSKQELLDEVWQEPELDPNAVEVCVLQLRKKIGAEWIQTVRNVGYRLVEHEA
ncbi:MAG: response regulator transcription factor [Actinomycetes bacterium]|jgi:DNA-binding response OmpR family regulator